MISVDMFAFVDNVDDDKVQKQLYSMNFYQ